MKKRILAIMAVLAGAAAGTAVTAVNYHLYRKAKEKENEKKDGPDVSDTRKTEDGSEPNLTLIRKQLEEVQRSLDNDIASVAPQATSEGESEEEKLMVEFRRRAEKVYGCKAAAYGSFAKKAKPVFNYETCYAYISINDAAEKTGYSANYIRECCSIPDLVGKIFFSDRKNGSVFGYISQTEYAKKPEEMTEVVTKEDTK